MRDGYYPAPAWVVGEFTVGWLFMSYYNWT